MEILASEKSEPSLLLKEGKMLNYSVFCQTRKKTLVPWTMEALDPPNVTFRQFLSQKVRLDVLQLDKTFVGKSKTNLDPVAPDLVVADVIQTFGPFVKYFVEQMTARLVTQGRPMYMLFIACLLDCD